MRIFLSTIVLCFCATFMGASPVKAAEEGIAVIINDSVITYSDIKDRIQLIMQSSGIPNTADMRKKMMPQITNMLIEEQLKLQEASELGFEVSKEKVKEGLVGIAKQNNIPVDKFEEMLQASGINLETLHDQIRAEIAWGRVVSAKVRPQIDVTETDIDAELAFLEHNIGGKQYLLSEIFLSVDTPENADAIHQTALKLYQQLKAKPDSLASVARQFSQAAGATNGGDQGWVETGQSEAAIELVLAILPKGTISQPIRSLSGYHIFFVRDKRSMTPENIPDREAIEAKIGNQRLSRRAKSYLLDLKANAFIENRV